jgi:polar amino acid transport system permease protein
MKFVNELLSYVVEPFLWNGALLAVEIAALAMVGGFLLGLGLALLRLSRLGPVRSAAWTYIWFIRGTPQLLQLVFLYDALPSVGIKLDSVSAADRGFDLMKHSAQRSSGRILSVNRNRGSLRRPSARAIC